LSLEWANVWVESAVSRAGQSRDLGHDLLSKSFESCAGIQGRCSMEVRFAVASLHHVQQIRGLFHRVALRMRLTVDPPAGHVAHPLVILDLWESLLKSLQAQHLA
jgi:hypothetical protein